MANTKISALTAATSPTGAEQIPAVQSGGNVAVTAEQLATWHPGFVAGNCYSRGYGRLANGANPGANVIVLVPLAVSRRMTISDLAVRIVTISGGGNIRLCLYAASSTTRKPTGTALGTCVISTGSGGTISATLGANVSLTAGLYWLGAQYDNATAVCQAANADTLSGAAALVGASTFANLVQNSGVMFAGYSAAATYASGAPDLTSATLTEISGGSTTEVFFKVTSVP